VRRGRPGTATDHDARSPEPSAGTDDRGKVLVSRVRTTAVTVDATIREARLGDVEPVQSVARETWHAAYDEIIGADAVEETIEDWYSLDGLRLNVRADDHAYYVAETDAIVGFGHANPVEEPGAWGLGRLYVRPDCWGEGIGTRLLQETRDERNDATVWTYEKSL